MLPFLPRVRLFLVREFQNVHVVLEDVKILVDANRITRDVLDVTLQACDRFINRREAFLDLL